MRAVAKRGESAYIVNLSGDTAQVYDADTDTLYPPANIHSITARGYWKPFAGEVTAGPRPPMIAVDPKKEKP